MRTSFSIRAALILLAVLSLSMLWSMPHGHAAAPRENVDANGADGKKTSRFFPPSKKKLAAQARKNARAKAEADRKGESPAGSVEELQAATAPAAAASGKSVPATRINLPREAFGAKPEFRRPDNPEPFKAAETAKRPKASTLILSIPPEEFLNRPVASDAAATNPTVQSAAPVVYADPLDIMPWRGEASELVPVVIQESAAAAIPAGTAARKTVSAPMPAFEPAPAPARPAQKPEAVDGLDPKRWLTRPVSFDVSEYSLTKLLREFASLQGVSCAISPKLGGSVSGLSAFKDPGVFLDLLCRAQNMNWYYDGTTVHFFPDSEVASRIFLMKGVNEDRLRQGMIELGLYDPRFSWKLTEDGTILMVQGPEAYLGNIDALRERQSQMASDQELVKRLGVFRLEHAWAADRTIASGDNQLQVPGVAVMLQQIVSGGKVQIYSPDSFNSVGGSRPRLARGNGLIGRNQPDAPGYADAYARADDAPVGGVQRGRNWDSDKDSENAGRDSEAPFIQADPRLNAVLVWDYERNMELYEGIIRQLDQPLALVEIRAAIVDVDVTRSRELGVSLEFLRDGGSWQNDVGSNVGKAINGLERITGDGFQWSTIYTKGMDQFMAKVSAIAKDGYANVLSRPSVLTQDNIEAIIQHTETFYVKLQGERQVDLADIKTGLTLQVTPHIIRDDVGANAVQLAVFIADGSSNTDDAVDNLPRVRESTISTQAVVYEGEALVVGGYYNEIRNNHQTGVPGLSRIPVLGALFRTKSKGTAKSERLFVLSPRIVYAGESAITPGSEGERAFEYSPARCLMNGPKVKDAKVLEDQKKWANRQ